LNDDAAHDLVTAVAEEDVDSVDEISDGPLARRGMLDECRDGYIDNGIWSSSASTS